MILKSEIKARNKITAIAALSVPVLRYRFDIVNWRLKEIRNIDRETRKKLTMYKMHNPKTGIDTCVCKKKKNVEEVCYELK
jgi:hypothetical protein